MSGLWDIFAVFRESAGNTGMAIVLSYEMRPDCRLRREAGSGLTQDVSAPEGTAGGVAMSPILRRRPALGSGSPWC